MLHKVLLLLLVMTIHAAPMELFHCSKHLIIGTKSMTGQLSIEQAHQAIATACPHFSQNYLSEASSSFFGGKVEFNVRNTRIISRSEGDGALLDGCLFKHDIYYASVENC
jgi:hypothetical protein